MSYKRNQHWKSYLIIGRSVLSVVVLACHKTVGALAAKRSLSDLLHRNWNNLRGVYAKA